MKKVLTCSFISILLLMPLFVAATPITPPDTGVGSVDDVYTKVQEAMKWVFTFGLIFVTIMVVVGGISYATAGGDDEKMKKAKSTVIWGLIGAAIIVLAVTLVYNIIPKFLGISGGISV